jgi:hypothetical protein
VINKSLTNDLLRQLKQPGAICSNDAKSCCDLIGHTVPKNIKDCLFSSNMPLTRSVLDMAIPKCQCIEWIKETELAQLYGAAVSTPIINSLIGKRLRM